MGWISTRCQFWETPCTPSDTWYLLWPNQTFLSCSIIFIDWYCPYVLVDVCILILAFPQTTTYDKIAGCILEVGRCYGVGGNTHGFLNFSWWDVSSSSPKQNEIQCAFHMTPHTSRIFCLIEYIIQHAHHSSLYNHHQTTSIQNRTHKRYSTVGILAMNHYCQLDCSIWVLTVLEFE